MSNFSIILKTLKMILFKWKFFIGIYLPIMALLTIYQTFPLQTQPFEFVERYHDSITFPNLILVFMLGIIGFADEFRLAASFNISRRLYFFGQSLALLLTAVALALLDSGFAILLTEASGIRFWHPMVPRHFLSEQTVNPVIMIASLNIALAFTGWLIRLLYYRANKLQKILLSISPVFLFFFFMYFILPDFLFFMAENRLRTGLFRGLLYAVVWLAYQMNTIINTSIIILFFSLLFAILCYLLIRRTPVK